MKNNQHSKKNMYFVILISKKLHQISIFNYKLLGNYNYDLIILLPNNYEMYSFVYNIITKPIFVSGYLNGDNFL